MKKEGTYLNDFYPINDNFGCFFEKKRFEFYHLKLISLVEFDFIDKVFRRLKTFEFDDAIFGQIFIDEHNPSKFVLVWKNPACLNIQKFELCEGNVSLDDTIQRTREMHRSKHYFNGCLYLHSATYEDDVGLI
jgi:hypothetical protein